MVFFGACSFGVLSTIVKLAYNEGFTLGDVTGTQVFFGLIVLWTIVLLRKLLGSKNGNTSFREKLKLAAMGTSTGLVSIFYYKCVQEVPASIAILLLMQFTWMSLVMDAILNRKMPSRLEMVSVALVLLGTALAGRLYSGASTEFNVVGVAFGLLAAFSYTLFLMINDKAGKALHPTTKSALILTGACIIIFAVFPPVFMVNGALFNGLFKWGFGLALFGTIIPPLFYAYGMPKTGLGLGAIISAAELPVAVLLSSLVLKEEVWPMQWLGVAIIIGAIVLSNANSLRSLRQRQKAVLV